MTNAATVITLDADLDMSTKEAWVPVTEFKGILDGNGKTISGLTIEATGNDAGLFITNNGIIKNLTLKRCNSETKCQAQLEHLQQ